MVKRYWNLMGKPEKKTVICRTNAYHGSTTATASLGGMDYMHRMDDLPIAGIEHVIQPYWYTQGGDLSEEEFGVVAARAVEERILEIGPERVGAFFGEPVQGSGGAILPPSTYWPEINRICKKYDILLVADEVVCGFGRTGEWFGSITFGIEPDFMTMAKGITSGYLPLSAVAVSDRVADVIYEKGGDFAHGYTYSGHPTACAVALANIAIIEREGLVERVREDIGPYFQNRLRALADHPLVGNIRGVGLIAGLAIVEDKATRKFWPPIGSLAGRCHEICVEMGAMIRVSGGLHGHGASADRDPTGSRQNHGNLSRRAGPDSCGIRAGLKPRSGSASLPARRGCRSASTPPRPSFMNSWRLETRSDCFACRSSSPHISS